MTPHPLVHLITGGLSRSPASRRAAELLAMMEGTCEALVRGRQCAGVRRYQRDNRWVCSRHRRTEPIEYAS